MVSRSCVVINALVFLRKRSLHKSVLTALIYGRSITVGLAVRAWSFIGTLSRYGIVRYVSHESIWRRKGIGLSGNGLLKENYDRSYCVCETLVINGCRNSRDGCGCGDSSSVITAPWLLGQLCYVYRVICVEEESGFGGPVGSRFVGSYRKSNHSA